MLRSDYFVSVALSDVAEAAAAFVFPAQAFGGGPVVDSQCRMGVCLHSGLTRISRALGRDAHRIFRRDPTQP